MHSPVMQMENSGSPKMEEPGDLATRWGVGLVTLLNMGGQELGASWTASWGAWGPEGGAQGRSCRTEVRGPLASREVEPPTGMAQAAGSRASPCHRPTIPG